jgi:hypothetical protein
LRRLLQLVRFVRVALAARTVQDFLLGGRPTERRATWDGYLLACQKRIDRLRVVDRKNPSWQTESRKRCLQLAAIAVALMERIDADTEDAR